jgi:K+-transporting ATPase ATPase C chain
MLAHLRPALVSLGLFTLLLGVAYPLAITAAGQGLMPAQANGSLVRAGDRVVGSALIGQAFAGPGYLHGRPSAAGADGYDASASSGSNLGPLNPDLAARVAQSAVALREEGDANPIPGDAVTTSASGLDPHISPAYAEMQAGRIAAARGADIAQVRRIVRSHVEDRTFGIVGQPRVNVLLTNLALDRELGAPQRPAR